MAFESLVGKQLDDVRELLTKEAGGTPLMIVTQGGPPQVMPTSDTLVVTIDETEKITAVVRSGLSH